MKKIRKVITMVLALVLLLPFLPLTKNVQAVENQAADTKLNKQYILHYGTPATDNYEGWEKEALPIGNGEIGNKLFGLIGKERIQFNEKTLWSGGPRPDDTTYNGGNYTGKHVYIPQIRKALEDGDYNKAKTLAEKHLVGPYNAQYGRYLSFGDVILDFTNQSKDKSQTTDYSRSLNLNKAVHQTKYTQNGTVFTRDSFVSYPDDVAVTRLEKNGNQALEFTVDLKLSTGTIDNKNNSTYKEAQTKAENNGLLLTGKVKDNDMKFASYLKVNTDGTVTVEGDKLKVANATNATLIFTAKTDYKQDPSTNYRDKDINVENEVKTIVDEASKKDYNALLTNHIEDYKELFERFDINLGEADLAKTTDQLLSTYNPKTDRYLEELFLQYGRYLLIASSRPGESHLPANLQGVWNAADNPPWNSDYHMNVNLQMNYWPVYSTNLSELAEPLINYIDDMRYYGRVAAKEYAGIESAEGEENGWLAHTQNTPFGWTTPGWSYYWGWSPAANAWILQNIYDQYRFTKDTEYLQEKIYPILKETAKFWNKFLHYDEKSGRYVSSPSYSPEHGSISIGNTFDQSLVWQLFNDFIEASKDLGVDEELRNEIKDKKEKLSPLHINKAGMIKEWYEEDTPAYTGAGVQAYHRHISHLVGLYPGNMFDVDSKYMQAAIKSLDARGNGGTGWSKANKINLWARTLDGNRAHLLLSEQLKNSTLKNLWDTHPPYQIDGNFGATSGMVEMLLQSHLGKIMPLPALPDAWKDGSVKGVLARGNFEVDMAWQNGNLKNMKLVSKSGSDLKLSYADISKAEVKINGVKANPKVVDENNITLSTKENDVITISNFVEIPTGLTVQRIDGTTANVEFTAIDGVKNYVITRDELNDNGEIVKTETFTKTESSFVDTIKPNSSYRYRIQAQYENSLSSYSRPEEIAYFREILDDRDPRVKYGSGWGDWPDNDMYDGTEKYIDNTGKNYTEEQRTATLTFEGDSIAIYGIKSQQLGLAKVYIDGKEKGTIDFYKSGATEKGAFIHKFDNLGEGEHTIKIVLSTETKNRPTERAKVSLDYFEIRKYQAEDPQPAPTPTPTPDPAEKVNKAELEKLIESIKKQDLSTKTEKSVENLNTEIETAKALLNNEKATQEEINIQIEKLIDALLKLEEKAPAEPEQPTPQPKPKNLDKKPLEMAIKLAKAIDLSVYTDESANNLKAVIAESEKVLNKENLTKEEIQKALENLQLSVRALEFKKIEPSVPSIPEVPEKPEVPEVPEKKAYVKGYAKFTQNIRNEKEEIVGTLPRNEFISGEIKDGRVYITYKGVKGKIWNVNIQDKPIEIKGYTKFAMNVRNDENQIVGILPKGTLVSGQPLGSKIRVTNSKFEGYIYTVNLQKEPVQVQGFAKFTQNIRDEQGKVIGILRQGHFVQGQVVEGRVKINYNGKVGYVYDVNLTRERKLYEGISKVTQWIRNDKEEKVGLLPKGVVVKGKISGQRLEISYKGISGKVWLQNVE